MRHARFWVLFAALFLIPSWAQAHPHVWITNVTAYQFEGGKLTGLRLTWTFDEMFSASIVLGFDRNKNGRFEPEELKRLQAEAFANLREYNYFLDIRLDDKPLKVTAVSDFTATIAKGIVTYAFTVPLPSPVDAKATKVTTSIADETYFVEVILDEHDPVRFQGIDSGACRFDVTAGKRDPVYGSVVTPQVIELSCG